jgi:hypothetical protein
MRGDLRYGLSGRTDASLSVARAAKVIAAPMNGTSQINMDLRHFSLGV